MDGVKFKRSYDNTPVEEILKKVVLGSESPVQYGAPSTVWKHLKIVAPKAKISLERVKEFVESNVRARALRGQPPSSKFKRLAYNTWGLGDQVQADLMFVETWRHKNILTVIDVFSRRAEAEICGSKAGHNVAAAMKRALERMKIVPNNIQTDQGKEFDNEHFKKLVRDLNSNWFFVDSVWKAAVVERFNRTLRMKYEVLKSQEKTSSQAALLRKAVWQYNNTAHSSLKGLTPNDITPQNNGALLRLFRNEKKLQGLKNESKQTDFKFSVGDFVRATITREATGGIRRKVAKGTYTEEVFKVTHRFRKTLEGDINLYKVEDLAGEPLTGIFYEAELKIAHGFDVNRKEVERVVSKRKRDSLVSLVDYPKSYREVQPNNKRFKRRR